MDIAKMLDELRSEREAIEEAILTLERLAKGQIRRRGRPPAWMSELKKKQIAEAQPEPLIIRKGRGKRVGEAAAQ